MAHHPFFVKPLRRPLVFGHRGASGRLPENTLASFRLALEEGADVLETDVHLTRDGQVVVAHDDDLERMSDGRGPLAAHTFAELRRLDAGHGFTLDDGASFPERGRGHRIPLLAEVFETFPQVRFNIELKQADPALARAVVALVRETDRAPRTLLTAGEDAAMATLRAEIARAGLQPALGASSGEIAAFIHAVLQGAPPPPGLQALQVPPAFSGQPLVTESFVAHAHAHELQVHVWTINREAEMTRLIELGVDGVMSDFPGRLRALLDARGAR